MTTTPKTPRRRPPLALILVCLAVGALAGAAATSSILRKVATEHAWTRGTMDLLAAHSGALGNAIRSGDCSDATRHLDRLAAIEPEILLAFHNDARDPEFVGAAKRLEEAIGAARMAQPANCEALAKVMDPIGASCKNCHTHYR